MTHRPGIIMLTVIVVIMQRKFAIMVKLYQGKKHYLEKYTIIQKTTAVPAGNMVIVLYSSNVICLLACLTDKTIIISSY